jgi:hypothetical protein
MLHAGRAAADAREPLHFSSTFQPAAVFIIRLREIIRLLIILSS